jgi:hypothetical protein
MSPQAAIKICYGGVSLYLLLALISIIGGDNQIGLLFLVGTIIWIVAAFVWARANKDQNG